MSASVDRARRMLARPGAWIDAVVPDRTYALRLGPTRSHRTVTTLDEAVFRALVETPGLRRRARGGWEASAAPRADRPSNAGAPGRIEGERIVMEADGRPRRVRANLGQSPIQRLALRRDADGRPFLTPTEVAAALRLGCDAEAALSGPSLTMRWDALPRSGGGSAARAEPGDRALNAADRIRRALAACPPDTRGVLDYICIREATLGLTEEALCLRRSEGRAMLKRGLAALARYYGVP
ncbi:DUF6456 domain-containing protein [Brevundimonas bacteroides]|uniref:DUF6456 domain-containing protein n=1 Tax=Brevundimonas bacteroides TaxID=74311 RepID=UPI000496DEF5|nr:DUF6456 domain-containing protein [Brevundimonas bacteroides]